MERFKGKLDKAEADLKKAEKHRKKYERAKVSKNSAIFPSEANILKKTFLF